MALRAVMNSKVPMVLILGATGTGKTKLGVELAQKFGTEIISADSMQIYKGLDVVTAKASVQEREMARHHLLDILDPHQMFTVVDFRNRALKIIDNLLEDGKIPIIVGGTNYYIESIVYRILVEDMDDEQTLLWDESRKKKLTDKLKSDAKRIKIDSQTDSDGKIVSNDVIPEESDGVYSIIDVKEMKNEATKNIPETSMGERDSKLDRQEYNTESTGLTKTVKMEETDNDSNSNIKVTDSLTDGDNILEIKVPPIEESACSSTTVNKKETKEQLRERLKDYFFNEKNFSNEEIHGSLRDVDPVMAGRLHPNNRRKVLRSIEVWLKSGRPHSEILAEQKLSEGQLRRPDSTIILWLKCEQTVHDKRLDDRVDAMLKDGLIEELLEFHARHNRQRIQDGNPPDYTKGIFQTLGFKEFHEYLMLNDEAKQSEAGRKLLENSIDNMKLATRRYARRQNKMVKGRFLEHPDREVPPVYDLDTTDVAQWDENVKNKAIHIIESFLNNSQCNYEPAKSVISEDKKKLDRNSYNYCEICQRIIIGDQVYATHMNSIKHSKVVKLKKRLAEKEQKALENVTENLQ